MTTILTEDHFDKEFVERLIACHPRLHGQELQVVAANGRYGVQSRARTILTVLREPVAVVVDADTVEPEAVAEQRDLLEMQLGQAAPPSEWKIVIVAPTLQALLFQKERVRRALLQREPSAEQLQRAPSRPKQVLGELLGEQDFLQVLRQRMKQVDLFPLWETEELRPVEAFLCEKVAVRTPVVAPS
jgi:hypothetical protein